MLGSFLQESGHKFRKDEAVLKGGVVTRSWAPLRVPQISIRPLASHKHSSWFSFPQVSAAAWLLQVFGQYFASFSVLGWAVSLWGDSVCIWKPLRGFDSLSLDRAFLEITANVTEIGVRICLSQQDLLVRQVASGNTHWKEACLNKIEPFP